MIKIHKALPVLVLLAVLASGFSGVQADHPQQDVTPTGSDTPAVEETAAPTEGQSAPVDENATTAEWPQVQNNPARTGFYSGSLGTNFTIGWRRAFQPEKIYPQVQAIVAGGKVLVGTEMGNLYALDALTGAQAWKYTAGGAILNSVAVADNHVFFGAMDGAVYALDLTSGGLVWKNQLSQFLGFSTAPLFADGKVMLGGRNGFFYALNPGNGSLAWSYDAGSPILMTAAWNGDKAYFGTMDMYVHAVDTTNGARAWKSPRIPGMAFKDFWPVVTGGMVYVRPMAYGYLGFDTDHTSLILNAGAQQNLLAQYEADPAAHTVSMFRLDESNGQLAPMVIHYNTNTMNGATAPPCVNRDGNLVVPTWLPNKGYFSGWGLLNPSSGILVDAFVDDNRGGGNADENMAVTCAQNMVLAMHIEEENANDTGYFNLDTRRWTLLSAGATNRQMANNTQGGGSNPASIANGWVYHITYYELVARKTN